MKIKNLIAIYSIVVGIAMILMWIMILTTRDIPEGKIELAFHLYAEFATAVILLVSGIMMLKGLRYSRMTNMGGLGMLVYSTLNAAGYYGQLNEKRMMIIFIIITVLSVAAISGHYYGRREG